MFWALLSSSEHSGVPEDFQPPTFPSVGLHPHTWPKWGCDIREAKYVFPKEFVLATKGLMLARRCGVVTFQFHAINKIKLPFEVKETSIHDNNEKLVKGVAHVLTKISLFPFFHECA